MQIKLEGFIRAWHWGRADKPLTEFYFDNNGETSEYSIAIQPCSIEVELELPENGVLTAAIVEALKKERDEIYVKATRDAAAYDDKISKLLALTNDTSEMVFETPPSPPSSGNDDDLPF